MKQKDDEFGSSASVPVGGVQVGAVIFQIF